MEFDCLARAYDWSGVCFSGVGEESVVGAPMLKARVHSAAMAEVVPPYEWLEARLCRPSFSRSRHTDTRSLQGTCCYKTGKLST